MSDNTTVDRMGSLFNDFLAAAEAIKERPQLEAKIRDAEAQRDRANSNARFVEERYQQLATNYDAQQAKIAKLEADLAQATFREKEAASRAELVLGALKDTLSNAKAAVELVEPPVEQAPAQPEVTVDFPFPYTDATSVEPEQSTAQSGAEPAGQSDTHPTVSLTDDTSPNVTPSDGTPTTSTTSGTTAETTDVLRRYTDKHYWSKPTNVSWRDWVAEGGLRPPWLKDSDLSNVISY